MAFMSPDPNPTQKTGASRKAGAVLGLVMAWVWAIVAGGGGFLLLLERGPWPLTNGWFAMFSGISACPLTAWLLNRLAGIKLSGRVRFSAALFFFLAGRIALLIGI
jgi:hypothetical protein